MRRKAIPVALTIAGSDSGGGAGIQADLKTFAVIGVHGASAITCVTAQNPLAVLRVQPCAIDTIRCQIDAVFSELSPAAVKTGMLFSAEIIRTVAEGCGRRKTPPLVVDPVMVATSGRRLLRAEALSALKDQLLPLASIVTPNLHEAVALVGGRCREPEDLRAAARQIFDRFGCAALVKGGHLEGTAEALDIFYDGKNELLLRAPRFKRLKLHGAGCTYSAAITAYLALGHDLADAVVLAKEYITQAIARTRYAGRHPVMGLGRA